MKRQMLTGAALAAAALIATPAFAQDNATNQSQSDNRTTSSQSYETTAAETAPDGSRAFGFEPYVAVMGGYFDYDRDTRGVGIPNRLNGESRAGAIVEGVVGANIPLGPLFVGVEGNVAKGVEGEIDWQYGVAGRVGFRAGESGLVYAKAGYEWVNFTDRAVTGDRDYGDEVYGLGVEVGPREIGLGGLTGQSGARLRLEVTTHDFESIRPMAGLVFHF